MLFTIVVWFWVSPQLKTPPPSPAVFELTVLLLIVTVPGAPSPLPQFRMPPESAPP